MEKISKILLPVDLQDAPKRVVHQIAVLARHFNSEIIMLHVVTPLTYSAGMLEGSYVPANVDDLYKELLRLARKHLDEALAPELNGLVVRRILIEGDPARTIVQTARNEKVDLIAMPTHGYAAFRRFLIGSVTSKVLHDSEYPVWTGAHLEEEPTREFAIRNVLCAIDLCAHSQKTVQWSAQMAAEFGARLTLAHITADVDVYGPDGFDFGPAWKEKITRFAAQHVTRLQQEMGIHGEVFIESGDVPKTLNLAAKKYDSDVLVIGRPSSRGRLRATGYGIIRESSIPVLSV